MSDAATPQVFSIPAGIAFADSLAAGLMVQAGDDPLALAAMTILLPTRRAARAVTDAFLRVSGGKALLLPRLLALADLDGDDDALAGGALPPALDPLQRRLILARLVMSRPGEFSVAPDQALRLAETLADLIDEAHTQGVGFDRLHDLAPEEFAGHWQATLRFLQIVTDVWPAILGERGAVDAARRRVLALNARADRWRTRPPADPTIAAGFISADPALAALIGVVARLPRGMAVLPGLDPMLDNEGWDAVQPTHPQYGLKRLLDDIAVPRRDVGLWPAVAEAEVTAAQPRARLLSEALRPAETTGQWLSGSPIGPASLTGIARIDCATVGEEAEVIALAMRHALETPGRTAALVTADRALARRVAAALKRWNIDADDSAGRPLGETPVGVWLRLLAEAATADFAPRPLLAVLKHPLAAAGLLPEEMRRRVRLLERHVLRGPRPGPGIAGLKAALRQTPDRQFEEGEKRLLDDWLDDLAGRLTPFVTIVKAGGGALSGLLLAHAEAAEALAGTPQEPGALRLWRGQDGEAAADLFARLEGPAGQDLPAIAADRYPAVLSALMDGITVRPLYGAHPRLAIWGLIEARLQQADLTILGGLNEGTWPPLPGDEPWMSRPMRARFGLEPPEVLVGLAAQDFALSAAAPQVLLTRSLRVDGAPSVPARWLSRLETYLKACGLALPHVAEWRGWAERIDRPDIIAPWKRPEPRPPLSARPRRLPVTAIEAWMRDPYVLYAQRILGLRALDPLDADPGAADRGKFIHHALDRFIKDYPAALPANALGALLAHGRAAFGEALSHPSVAAFWWPRFERIAGWFLAFERDRRQAGAWPLATEIKGGVQFDSRGGVFTLTATADRIDRLPDGRLAIIDYKTGRPPSAALVAAGVAPQLPLEAAIAEQGGFSGVTQGEVAELAFLRLSGGNPPGELIHALGAAELAEATADAWDGLLRLVEAFDDPATPYAAKPRPDYAYPGDYDHLARPEEWASS
jgi:ATP-dependent helicase/nuclease subunit B